MKELFISPFLLGLSTGIYCFAYCLPFVAPFMVSEARDKKADFLVVLKFIYGRFMGYLLFGAVIGYWGERINSKMVNEVLIGSLMLLSIVLILHALGLLGSRRFSLCLKVNSFNPKLPVVMGFLLGVNICPPFLISLTYVFTLHSMVKGIIYFLMFFIGTSIYFLPFFFLGFLNRQKEFQLAGRISALMVGIFFLTYGFYTIFKGAKIVHLFK